MTSFTKPLTIAVLTDIHYGAPSLIPQRHSEIADTLLLRAVHRLNRLIKPNITVVLGDLVDNGDAVDTGERLEQLHAILDKLHTPYIVIPGNHDGDADAFYRVFERPADIADLAGIRFLPFIDQAAPGYNATRRVSDIARFRAARNDYDGPIVALQHVCLAPPSQSDIPYNYTNAQAIADAMTASAITLSISGHYHAGTPVVRDKNSTFVNAPTLCEAPFRFLTVTLDQDQIAVQHHQLAMPKSLGLIDNHIHTQLAYCGENVTVERVLALAQDFGLAGVGFTEHSGQLYFDQHRYWGQDGLREGIASAQDVDNRTADYWKLKQLYASDTVRFGLEVDCDFQGELLLKAAARRTADFLSGSIHSLPRLKDPHASLETLEDEFMFLLARLLQHRVHILAHPFRIFRARFGQAREKLFLPVVELLQKSQTAAEINFHLNEPPVVFVKLCLERGVKLSFGSDTHNLYELGEFALHLQLLREAGFDGDFADILVAPNQRGKSGG